MPATGDKDISFSLPTHLTMSAAELDRTVETPSLSVLLSTNGPRPPRKNSLSFTAFLFFAERLNTRSDQAVSNPLIIVPPPSDSRAAMYRQSRINFTAKREIQD
jgi:hypothetical protein